MKFKKNTTRVIESTYDVFVDGEFVGFVHPTWKRFGGAGWTYVTADGHSSRRFDTRKEAASHMIARRP